jgi:transposase-like protein
VTELITPQARGTRGLAKKQEPGDGGSPEGVRDDVQRWTARRRVALVLSILKGELSVAEGAQRHALSVAEIEEWKERFLGAAHNALRSKPRDEEGEKDEQIRRLKQKVGELVLDNDMLRDVLRGVRAGAEPTDE